MHTDAPTVDLAALDLPRRRRRGNLRGRLVYLADLEAVAVPHARVEGGWTCHIVAGRHRDLAPRQVEVSDDELAGPPTRLPADRGDLAAWQGRMLWQAWTFARWPGGRMATLCRLLAEELRRPHTLLVDLPAHTVNRLLHQINTRPAGLRNLLRRLVVAGALTPVTPATGDGWGRHNLIIPGLPIWVSAPPQPCGADPSGSARRHGPRGADRAPTTT